MTSHPTEPKLPESLEVVAEPFKALRESTAAVLTPIGNMTDRQTVVLRTMERRLAFQQACNPHTIDTLLRRLTDAESALKTRDAEIERLRGALRTSRGHVQHNSLNAPQQWLRTQAAFDLQELDAAIDQARATGGEKAN